MLQKLINLNMKILDITILTCSHVLIYLHCLLIFPLFLIFSFPRSKYAYHEKIMMHVDKVIQASNDSSKKKEEKRRKKENNPAGWSTSRKVFWKFFLSQ